MSKVGQRILTSLREAVTIAELQAEITRLRADLAAVTAEREKCAEEITEACELLHKLTAIIPGNDGAGEEVAKFLRDAAIRSGK